MSKHPTPHVFVSFSGERSRAVASALVVVLSECLPTVRAALYDPAAGQKHLEDLLKHLENAKIVVPCLTPENVDSTWIHFEAGAVATRRSGTKVMPFLLDMPRSALSGPLALFAGQRVGSSGATALVSAIATALGATVPTRNVATCWNRSFARIADRLVLNQSVINENNPIHVQFRHNCIQIERGTPLRHFIARYVLNKAADAMKQAADRQKLLRNPSQLTQIVGQRLRTAIRVWALCGGKPWPADVKHRYYRQCFEFAERQRGALRHGASLTRYFPEPPRRSWPADDWPVLVEHHRRHRRGVRARVVTHAGEWHSPEVRDLVSDLMNRGVGFILIEGPEGTVAFSHRGDGASFHASEWTEPFALMAMHYVLDELDAQSRDFLPREWRNRPRSPSW